MTILDGLDGIRAAVGRHLGYSSWIDVTHVDVDRFEAATGGRNLGLLAVSLTNRLLPEVVAVRGVALGVNYGTGPIRFPAPLPVPARIRLGAELVAAADIPGGVQTTMRLTVQVDGGGDPACIVDSLSRYLPPAD